VSDERRYCVTLAPRPEARASVLAGGAGVPGPGEIFSSLAGSYAAGDWTVDGVNDDDGTDIDSLLDLSGNSRNAVSYASTKPTTGTFNGVRVAVCTAAQYFEQATAVALGDNWTSSVVVKCDAAGAFKRIISIHRTILEIRYDSGGNEYAQARVNGSNITHNVDLLAAGGLHRLMIVNTSGGNAEFFVDGASVGTATAFTHTAQAWGIGAHADGTFGADCSIAAAVFASEAADADQRAALAAYYDSRGY
jgi:hypothetical protein